MNCPHCNKQISDSLVITESQRLIRAGKPNFASASNGRKGGRPLGSKNKKKIATPKKSAHGA